MYRGEQKQYQYELDMILIILTHNNNVPIFHFAYTHQPESGAGCVDMLLPCIVSCPTDTRQHKMYLHLYCVIILIKGTKAWIQHNNTQAPWMGCHYLSLLLTSYLSPVLYYSNSNDFFPRRGQCCGTAVITLSHSYAITILHFQLENSKSK